MMKKLLSSVLKVTAADRICIIYDSARESTATAIKTILHDRAHSVHTHDGIVCDNLPLEVRNILVGTDFNVIIICIRQEQAIWHSAERRTAKYKCGKRLASVIAPYEFLAEIDFEVDSPLIKALGLFVHKKLKPGAEIHIFNKAGTNIYAQIGQKPFCEDGDYSTSFTGGDFPFGEVGFAPELLTVQGQVVYDLKIQHLGTVIAGDVILKVQDDEITDVAGTKSSAFNAILAKNNVLKYISEISFGINPFINIFDNTTNIIEEKKAGTVHFGHGGNAAYGKRVGPHFDCVIGAPTVIVDGSSLMEEGKFYSEEMPEDLKIRLFEFNLIR